MHLASDLQQSAGDLAERRALKLVLYDALASEAMGTLTTGVFLVGFAVALGANNFAIGVLAAVPFFVQLLQVPAVLLVERWRVRYLRVQHGSRPRISRRGRGSATHWRFTRCCCAHCFPGDLSRHGSDRRLCLEFVD